MHQSMAPGFNSHADGFDMESPANETEIIDEEELKQLKLLKELKSQYRSLFKELKELRNGSAYTQQAIDNIKQKLVHDFEEWYQDTFECSVMDAASVDMAGSAAEQYASVSDCFYRGSTNLVCFLGGQDEARRIVG